MSSSLNIACDNCGWWISAAPDSAEWFRGMPKGWVAVYVPNRRVHLCDKCWAVTSAVLGALPERASGTHGWQRFEGFTKIEPGQFGIG